MRKRYRNSGQSGNEILTSMMSFFCGRRILKEATIIERSNPHRILQIVEKILHAAPGLPSRAKAKSTVSLVGVFKDFVQFVQISDCRCGQRVQRRFKELRASSCNAPCIISVSSVFRSWAHLTKNFDILNHRSAVGPIPMVTRLFVCPQKWLEPFLGQSVLFGAKKPTAQSP